MVMLKTVKTDQITLGMYVHDFKVAWMKNPFWKKSLKIKTTEDLAKLVGSGIKEVVIDTSKGVDVAAVVDEDTIEVEAEKRQPNLSLAATSFEEEQEIAAEAIAGSKSAVQEMFDDVRMGKAISTESAMPIVEELTASVIRNQGALISLVRLKTQDDYTYMHSVAVCALMVSLAKQLGLSDEETRQAGLAGLMHDIGKSAIPEAVLNKPGKLTDEEFSLVKLHPERGHQLLIDANVEDSATLDVSLNHHEKIDGTGYPNQLKGDELSIFAKMGAVCDVYDAVTSKRIYKQAWEPGIAIKRMSEWEGHFDEAVFNAFIQSVGIYPIGTLVMLKSKQLAVVIQQHENSLLTPIVKIFFSVTTQKECLPRVLDLSSDTVEDKIVSAEDPAIWSVGDTTKYWKAPEKEVV